MPVSLENTIRINKYLPVAVLYFFFNSFLLPHGLLYTTLLTPVFLLWLYQYKSFQYLWLFFIISAPFVLVHLIKGVDILVYLKSYVLQFTVFVFCLCFFQFLRLSHSLGAIFKSLVLINLLLVCLALVVYFIEPLRDLMWYKNLLTPGVERMYRLKLFTYEASYYSLLLIPIALYYYLKMLLLPMKDKAFLFFIITFPLLLSLSFGVISGLVLTLVLLLCSDLRLLLFNRKLPRYILITLVVMMALMFIAVQLFPDNFIFVRIENIFKGRDTSFSGRTLDSIFLGWKIAAYKSLLFGAGAGQIKVLGLELFNTFYIDSFTPDQLAIPNNIGDTLAQYGLLGVLFKLSLEVYFFFRSRVYGNYYRLGLFLFVFIYQFTGSYITNIAEYVIWLMAFYPTLFPQFDKVNIFPDRKGPDFSTHPTQQNQT